jgi:2,6-dihydroxypseudooxynicotine hydrolase
LPLLPSGKADQQALKKQARSLFHKPSSRRSVGPIAALEDVMEALTQLIVEELDVKLRPEQVTPDIALLQEGVNLDSIALVRLITLIKTRFNLAFHDSQLEMAALQSVRTLSTWIYEQLAPQTTAAQPVQTAGEQRNPSEQVVQNLRANVSLLHLRATTFGISYADLLTVNEGASDPASWSAGLAPLAERYEAAAQEAVAERRWESARQWWQMTVNYYHFTQMFLEGEARQQYREKCWQAYQQLAALVAPACQRVAIPYQEMTLPGYLRVARPGAPCVILLGGFEFAKEAELHQWGNYFLERGLSVLAFDGPGQGEIAAQSTMRGDFETVIASAIDFLERQGGLVGATGIGLFGVSLGGYVAMRAAALEKRVTACISLSGPFDGSTTRNLAPRNQLVTARLFGFTDAAPLLDPAGPLNLATAPQAMTQPLFIIHGSLDHIVPAEQIAMIQAWARGTTKLWTLEGSEHCCFSRANEVLPTAGDWMARQLGVGLESRNKGQAA